MRNLLAVGFLCTVALSAMAADRVVFFEDYTATWCGPCHTQGGYLAGLMDTYPDRVIVVQEHINSQPEYYWTSWGHSRFLSYGNTTYIPDVWVDGIEQQVGVTSPAAVYNTAVAHWATPTDITVLLGAQKTHPEDPNDPSYNVTARLIMDANGTQKTVRLVIAPHAGQLPDGRCLLSELPRGRHERRHGLHRARGSVRNQQRQRHRAAPRRNEGRLALFQYRHDHELDAQHAG